jgi:hypothetical protein
METLRRLILVVCLAMLAAPAWSQSGTEKIKTDYQTVSAKLEKHIVHGSWIDDDPESPGLLAQQWSLAGEWVAAWLNALPHAEPAGVGAAVLELAPSSTPQYLVLNATTFLVASPSPIGNVFIVSKSGSDYRVAWNIAQWQEASGKSAEVLAAWRPEHALDSGRGPNANSGSVVPLRLGILPSDAKGRARFYIEGFYAQEAGGTGGEQISLWVWDGVTARLQLARYYLVMIDQKVGTRMEGDLLKVQQKKSFRAFFSCGSCEERQTDWIVRITPEGVKELGEKSAVPELDAVDELFYRVINGKSASDIAAPEVIETATHVVDTAREGESEKEWKEFPSLGMMGEWSVTKNKDAEVLCFYADDVGTAIFKLRSAGDGFFITDVRETNESCPKRRRVPHRRIPLTILPSYSQPDSQYPHSANLIGSPSNRP